MKYLNKRGVIINYFLLIISILLLSSCAESQDDNHHTDGELLAPSTDSYQLSILDIYHLTEGNVICEVEVEQVFQNKYTYWDNEDNLVLICTVKQVFYPENESSIMEKGCSSTNNNQIAVWVNIEGFESSENALRELFFDTDSLIVYAREMSPRYYSPDSVIGRQWLSEDNQDDTAVYTTTIFGEPQEYLDLPPCLWVFELDAWTILPLKDGRFDSAGMVEAVKLSEQIMDFSVDGTNSSNMGYFIDGKTNEEMYDAVKRLILGKESSKCVQESES